MRRNMLAVATLCAVTAVSAAYADGGAVSAPVPNPTAVPQAPVSPDAAVPQPPKAPGISDTGTAGTAPASPPGTDTSTVAPGGQAESSKNGALGTTGTTMPQRHHGPVQPSHKTGGTGDSAPAGGNAN